MAVIDRPSYLPDESWVLDGASTDAPMVGANPALLREQIQSEENCAGE
jgi:hypothetical protein